MIKILIVMLAGTLIFLLYIIIIDIKAVNKCNNLGGIYMQEKCLDIKTIPMDK